MTETEINQIGRKGESNVEEETPDMMGNRNRAWQLAGPLRRAGQRTGISVGRKVTFPSLGYGQAVGETLLLSLDPYQWNRRRNDAEQPGEVCGRTVSRIIRSRHTIFVRETSFLIPRAGGSMG